MATQIQVRRDTAANWTSSNPILAQGEQGLETDTGKVKFGDGTSTWSALPYSGSGQLAIDDLTDVDTTGVVGGDVLKWNGTTWTPTTDDDSTPNLDQVTTQGNTTTNAITVGSATVTNGLTVDGTTLVVDDTNNLVGIGTASPGYNLTVENAGGSSTLGVIAATTGQSIINLGDTSNGVVGQVSYDHTDNSMRFNTAAAERMRIDVSGNVGIGTDSPNRTLTVSSASGVPAELISSSTNSLLAFFDAGTGVRPSIGSAGSDIVFNVNSSERMRIDSSGNVGIGTAAPATALHVDVGTSNDALRLVSTDAQTNILMGDNAGSVRLQNDGGAFVAYSGTSSFSGFAERMRIDSSGNVGIGTDSPTLPLDIVANTGGNAFQIRGRASDGIGYLRFSGNSGASPYAYVGSDDGADLRFDCNGAERMRITSSGNVGIGTSSPAANLEVKGTHTTGDKEYVRIWNENGAAAGDLTSLAFAHGGGQRTSTISSTLESSTKTSLVFSTDNSGVSEKMRITSNGNVGIGTSVPQKALAVFGGILAASSTLASTSGITIDSTATVGYGATLTHSDVGIQWETNGGSRDYTWGDGTNEFMRITSDGRVGVDTSSPTAKLDVVSSPTSGTDAGNSQLALRNTNPNRAAYINFSQDADLTFYNTGGGSGNDTVFVMNTGEAMRIDSSGNLLVGTTSVPSTSVNGSMISDVETQACRFSGSGTASRIILNFINANGTVGSVSTSGTATAYNTSSDVRLKENIVDAPAGNIDALQVRSFDWKADGEHQTYGFVAQELDLVAPYAVTKGDTEEDMWAVDYSKLVPMLVKEIQDLKAEVEALKNA